MTGRPVPRLVLLFNAAAAVVTIAFSVGVMTNPALGLPAGADVTGGATLYAQATGLRSIALAVVTLVAAARRSREMLAPLLAVTGLVQVGDGALHVVIGLPALVLGAAVLAAVPLGSLWLLRVPRGRTGGAPESHGTYGR